MSCSHVRGVLHALVLIVFSFASLLFSSFVVFSFFTVLQGSKHVLSLSLHSFSGGRSALGFIRLMWALLFIRSSANAHRRRGRNTASWWWDDWIFWGDAGGAAGSTSRGLDLFVVVIATVGVLKCYHDVYKCPPSPNRITSRHNPTPTRPVPMPPTTHPIAHSQPWPVP